MILPVTLLAAFLTASRLCAQSSPPDDRASPVSGDESGETRPPITISGTCRDGTGAPLPGAHLRLYRIHYGLPPEKVGQVECAEDGRFHFSDVPAPPRFSRTVDWTYTLVAQTNGRETRVHRIRSVEASREQAIELRPSARLKGRIVDPAGEPIVGALVWYDDIPRSIVDGLCVRTDSAGNFTLDGVRAASATAGDSELQQVLSMRTPDRGQITIERPDFARTRIAYKRNLGKLSVELRPGGNIRGTVLDLASRMPARGVVVVAEPFDRTRPAEGERFVIRTDNQGKYEVTDMPAGQYRVQAESEKHVCLNFELVTVEANRVADVPEMVLTDGGILEGRILTLRNRPVSHDPSTGKRLTISLHGKVTDSDEVFSGEFDVEDDGRFRAHLLPGRYHSQITVPRLWELTWRRSAFENGLNVIDGQTTNVVFRILDATPAKLRPKRADGGWIKLPETVAAEQWAANEIRELGGWYQVDAEGHVVEVNMVYHVDGRHKERSDNANTESDEALRSVCNFPRLQRLYLCKGQATDDAMKSVTHLKELRYFYAGDASQVSDAGVRHLGDLKELVSIHISNSQIGNDSLALFATLPKVRRLAVEGNAFTDEGLAHLARMRALELLSIGPGTVEGITDAGLEHLHNLTSLLSLDLIGTAVTPAGIAELQRVLPGLQILHE